MAISKKALGRGLGAIFEEVTQSYENDLPRNEDSVVDIQIEDIRPNPYQPRKTFDANSLQELSDSIVSHGLLQPIIVIKDKTGFMLIAGERRLRASKLASLDTIRAIIADIDLAKLREMALIENIQREDLNPIDLAYSYQELLDEHEITHEQLSSLIFKSRTQITNTLRLLNLDDYTQQALVEGKISQGHARALIGLDKKEQKVLVDSIVGQKLSVREVEEAVKGIKHSDEVLEDKKVIKKDLQSYDYDGLENLLGSIGVKYKLKSNTLSFNFDSQEDVKQLISLLKDN